MIKFRDVVFLLLVACAIFYSFWGLTQSFYQQDEWHGLGGIITGDYSPPLFNLTPFQILLGEGRIFGNAIVYLLLGKFTFNIIPAALFAIVFHLINAVLVYFLARKFVSPFSSLLGAIFFSLNGTSYGAITWPVSAAGTLPATTLILMSIFAFFKFLESKKGAWIYTTFFLVYFSLYFKEIGVFLFAFYPVFDFLKNKIPLQKLIKRYWMFIIFMALIVGVRLLQFKSIDTQQDLFLTGASTNYSVTLILRALFYPLASFGLTLIPTDLGFSFAKLLSAVFYPQITGSFWDLVSQTGMVEVIGVSATFILISILYLVFGKDKTETSRMTIFIFLFVWLGFLPYIILSKSAGYLESRYYYLAAAGVGVLISLIFGKIYNLKKTFLVIFLSILLFIIYSGFKTINKEVTRQADLGLERKQILTEVTTLKPALGKKTVIYAQGDRNFYIEKGNPFPVQQGLGYTLLAWYTAQGKSSKDLNILLDDHYLWEMTKQGYRESGDSGFGFFSNYEALVEFAKNNPNWKEMLFAIYYDSGKKKVIDNTQEVIDKVMREI